MVGKLFMREPAAERTNNVVATIPFRLAHNHIIYLAVSVNGAPLEFVLDTGATTSLINLESIGELNIKSLSQVPIGGAGNAEVFGHIIEPADVEIAGLEDFTVPLQVAFPFAEVSAFEESSIDGILGYEFFSSFTVEIDYKEKLLTLYEKDGFEYSGAGSRVALELRSNHPHLKATIFPGNGEAIEGDFVVDTGAGLSISMTRPFTEQNGLLEKVSKKIKTPTAIGVGGVTQGYVSRFEKLVLGDAVIEDPIASFMMDENGVFATSDFFEGIIGGEILRNYTVVFDYQSGSMFLEKEASERAEYDMSGIFPAREGTGFRIAGLTENSPATEAGLKMGDIIVGIDGAPAGEYSLSGLGERSKVSGNLGLKIRRGDEILEKHLELRVLV